MPTVRQLEYLVAIAEVKHFRKAAEHVNTTQPTLSGQLKALEERLGLVLVERSRSRVAMTPAGAEIADIARRVLRDVREIRAVGTSRSKKMAGVVRLGVPPSIGPSLVPRLTRDLREEYPDLKFYVREESPLQLENALADGTYDIVIGPLPFAGGAFEAQELYTEPLHLVMPVGHALAKKASLAPGDLRGLNVLTLDATHPLSAMVRQYCGNVGARVLTDYTGTSLDTLRDMVATNLGTAFLPALYVRTALAGDKSLAVATLKGRPLVRTIGVVWRRSGAHTARFADLARFLKATSDKVIGKL